MGCTVCVWGGGSRAGGCGCGRGLNDAAEPHSARGGSTHAKTGEKAKDAGA